MNYIIIDDEPLAHNIILSYADSLEELKLVGQAYSAKESLNLLKGKIVDLIFLDIEMPNLKGIDLLKTLKNKPLVIFTTAYEEYAIQSYELDAVDYLLKPFSLERFLKAVNKAYDFWNSKSSRQGQQKESKADTLFIKSDKNIHQVKYDDILCLESDGGYVKVYQNNGNKILSSLTLQELEEKLPDNFLRVHKSYIISIPKLEKIEGNRIIINDLKLPIGRHYKKMLIQRIGLG